MAKENKESQNPNLDREKDKRKTKSVEHLKEKYSEGSHTGNTKGDMERKEGPVNPKIAKDNDLTSKQSPSLNRQKKREQNVEENKKRTSVENDGEA
jgi:hypothetical protein